MSRKLVDLDVTLVRDTPKAVLVQSDVSGEVWVPKSLCQYEKNDPNALMPCAGTITLSEGIAHQKELL